MYREQESSGGGKAGIQSAGKTAILVDIQRDRYNHR